MSYSITNNVTVQSVSTTQDVANLLAIKDLIINVARIATFAFSYGVSETLDLSHLQINRLSVLVIKSSRPVDISLVQQAGNDVWTGVMGTFHMRLFVGTSAVITQLKVRSGLEAGNLEVIVGIPLT